MSALLCKETKKAFAHVVNGLFEMEIRLNWVAGVGYAISGVLYFCTCVYVRYTCACVHWCGGLRLAPDVFFSCVPLNTTKAQSFARYFSWPKEPECSTVPSHCRLCAGTGLYAGPWSRSSHSQGKSFAY